MKNIKEPKAPKTYTFTFWQLVGKIALVIMLFFAGAIIGAMIERTISDTINRQVKEQTAEQVKVFTEAVK